MKKSMIKKLVVLVVVMVVAGGFVFGEDTLENNSTSVELTGAVATEMSVVATAGAVSFSIDPYDGYDSTVDNSFDIALTAKSNNFGGYKVTATSDGGFALVGDNNQTNITYSVFLDTFGAGVAYTQDGVSALNGDSIPFNVTVAAAEGNPYESGTYTDTVTLTIANN